MALVTTIVHTNFGAAAQQTACGIKTGDIEALTREREFSTGNERQVQPQRNRRDFLFKRVPANRLCGRFGERPNGAYQAWLMKAKRAIKRIAKR